MNSHAWLLSGATGLALFIGLFDTREAAANGGPFVIKYPDGDPAAKGVLARIDPDLKPGREERLSVVKENLKVIFLSGPQDFRRPSAEVPRAVNAPGPSDSPRPLADPGKGSNPEQPPESLQPPLAAVAAIYTIKNPTDAPIEVEFGFPILRGIYIHPFSMMPTPEVKVTLDAEQIRPDLISNSMIYGMIRERARRVIEKAIAADPQLARLVATA